MLHPPCQCRGDEAWLAAAAVVGGQHELAPHPGGDRGTAVDIQQLVGRAGAHEEVERHTPFRQDLGRKEERRQTDATDHERRPRPGSRKVEATPQGDQHVDLVAGTDPGKTPRPAAHHLHHELDLGAGRKRSSGGEGERTPQQRVEPPRATDHRELARARLDVLARLQPKSKARSREPVPLDDAGAQIVARYHAEGIMRHLQRLGHSLAAGALAGAALAPIQFLLWADQAIEPARAVLGFLAWSSWGAVWLGTLMFLVVELFVLAPAVLSGRHGFSIDLWRGLAAAVGFGVALLALWNQRITRDLLVGPNRQAIEVSGWVAAVFGTLSLVLALRRPSRRHPLVLSAGVAGVFLALLWSAWLMTPPMRLGSAATEVPRFPPAHRLLLVSWEGADLGWLLPLMEKGSMPFLQSRFTAGSWGQLRTVRPYTRHAALATLLTGCNPAVHGVLGRRSYRLPWLFSEPVTLLLDGPWPNPHQLPWRAWQRAARPAPRRATISQVLIGAGSTVGRGGWPTPGQASWEVPAPLASESIPFEALDGDLRAAVAPGLAAVPDGADAAMRAFSTATEQYSRLVARLGQSPVDSLTVNSTLPLRLRPQFTAQEPGDPAEEVLRQAARLLDSELRSLWVSLGGENVLLVVASPYGLAPPSPWRRLAGLVGLADRSLVSPAESPDGFVLFSGPGVRPATRFRPRRLADVVPTVLYLLELPVARDMAGGAILEAVTDEHATRVPLRRVASYPPLPSGR